MIVITKSCHLEERLAAAREPHWLRLPVLVALSLMALAAIILMATGRHGAAALGFFCVALLAMALRIHDVGTRPDQDHLSVGLAGERAVTMVLRPLDDRYVLINGLRLTQPAAELDHVLLGPHGLLAIETKAYGGHIACLDGHWRRWVARPDGRVDDLRIGNPSAQLARALRLVHGLVASWDTSCPAQGAIVFTHPEVEIEQRDAPFPVLRLEDVLTFVRKLPGSALSPAQVAQLAARFRDYDAPAGASRTLPIA